MRKIIATFAALAVLLAAPLALAQAPLPPQAPAGTADVPFGFPYNTGTSRATEFSVPLRDFMSARLDQVYAELLRIMDERDLRYSQRFEAQNDSVAAALASAERAVAKAETASDIRFSGVNEFRQTLSDQALHFANKEAVASEFDAVRSSITTQIAQATASIDALTKRLDAAQNQNEGASNLWVLIGGAVLFLIAVVQFASNTFRKSGGPST